MDIKFNAAGFQELLTSAGAESLLDEHSEQVTERANAVPSTTSPAATEPYYKAYEASDANRARRRIVTVGQRAIQHEAITNALQRSI